MEREVYDHRPPDFIRNKLRQNAAPYRGFFGNLDEQLQA